MKKIIFITFLFCTILVNGQVTYTGTVKDSIGNPLEMANVIALDTVAKKFASYGFTDAKGNFKLELETNKVYNIKISYVGFKSISKFIKTGKIAVNNSFTMLEDNQLEGIEIVTKIPVTIKGDTIVYDADSFKNGTERKLEDVLKKLPGVEVNDAGQIEVEGKVVEKVMVDGKEFFSGDSKLASKNIPSKAVDKIQVLRNYGDVNQLKGVQNNQDRVAINIKLKEGKKNFWFGDITAGVGQTTNQNLYLFQPKLFYYSPDYTLNFISDINNLGDVVLTRRDLRSFGGGFRSQSPSNGTNINIGDTGIGFLTANARNANRIETKLSTLNFTYLPNKKLDLSGFLIWSGNSNGQRRVREIDNFNIEDNPNTPEDETAVVPDDLVDNTTDQTSNTALFRLGAIYKKNINNQLNYTVTGRFSNEFRTDAVNSSVLSDILEKENATPFKINQNLSYFYTANDKNIFALELKHLLQNEDPFYVASLDNNPFNDDEGFDDAAEVLGLNQDNLVYTLEQDRKVKTNQLDAKLDYYYILNKKSNLNFVAGSILSKQNFNSKFFQILDNQEIFEPNPIINNNNNLSTENDVESNFLDFYTGLRYRLKTGIFTFTPGATLHSYTVNNTQPITNKTENTTLNLLPEFEAIAQFKKSESLRFRYNKQVNFIDVNQLANGIVASNYNAYFYGNEALLNATSDNLRVSYSSFNLYNGTNSYLRVNYSKTANQVNRNVFFRPGSVVSSSTSINSPFENENFLAFTSLGKRFKKIRTSIGGSFSINKLFQFRNGLENTNTFQNKSLNTRFSTNFNKAPNISLRYRVSFGNQESSIRSGVIKTVTHRPSVDFDAYIFNSVTFTSDFSYNNVLRNKETTNTFSIWNAKLAYRKNKNAKWEYELVGNNLLGTNSETTIIQGSAAIVKNETFILPRLISFRVRYQL